MAFLDDIDRKISRLGQGAIQKTKEVSDTAKISTAIRGLEVQRKDYMTSLGEMYYMLYRQYGGEVTGELKNIILQIQSVETELEQQKEQMQRIKGVIYCPNCNSEIMKNSAFCNVCGAKIVQQSVPISNSLPGNTCRQCGAPVREGQSFCVNCGAKVEQQINEPDVEGQEKVQSVIQRDVKNGRCPSCGAEVTKGQAFCIMCGAKMEIDRSDSVADIRVEEPDESLIYAADAERTEENDRKKYVCSECGQELEANQKFCTNCGKNIL